MNSSYETLKAKLKKACIGIAGCGGLGSNCAISLARIGIAKLVIADFDVVSPANLNRQYFFIDQIGMKKVDALKDNILRINPDIEVIPHVLKLKPEYIVRLFKDCDIIVEAFDLAEMKQMLIETVLSQMPDKYIVSGNGLAGWGKNDMLKTQQFGKLFICGDQQLEISDEFPPLAPRVSIVANMQANLVLELLMNQNNK